jgi:hypothetical protein
MRRVAYCPALLALTLLACRPMAPDEPAAPNVQKEVPPTAEIAPDPALDRENLLTAAFRARSAAASGRDDQAAQAALDGRDFELRLPLGCEIQTTGEEGSMVARLDADRGRIELRATPDIDLTHPLAAEVAANRFEAAEGFWIPHPWLLTSACMSGDGGAAVGLVQFFTRADPRTSQRRGRAYVARETIAAGAEPPPAGSWSLIFVGRLRALGDGRVIHCRAGAEGGVPDCVISVELDSVAIENVRRRERLAEWNSG